jgi:hypothetical protein
MSWRLLQRRGTAIEHSTFTGLEGEITYDKTNKRFVAHDGVTAGGFPAAKLSEVVTTSRTQVADANYTILTTDRVVGFSSISNGRTLVLPAASAYSVGVPLWIIDESGSCSSSNTITINRTGSDTIDGAISTVMSVPYGVRCLVSNGSNKWTIVVGEPNLNAALVGINAIPDATNKLYCKSSAILFDNIGGSVQVKVNKSAIGDTGSFVFQRAFSGRAEIGNIGDDDFQFKLSNDGSTFYEGLRLSVNNSAALVALAGGRLKFPATQIPSSDPNTLDDYEEGTWTPSLLFGGASTGVTGAFAGTYTTVGNLVVAIGIIALTNKGSATGTATISGLPFTVKANYNGAVIPTFYSNMANLTGPIISYASNGANTIALNTPTSTGVSAVTDQSFQNASNFQFCATYLR